MFAGNTDLKIAELVATFPPYHGGMGYVCFHNALELARRGHDVTVFTLEHGRLNYDNDPQEFKIVRLRTPFIYGDGGIAPQLFFRLLQFDIIHIHYPFYGGAEYLYLASLLKHKRYFLTYHMDVVGNTFLKKAVLNFYESMLLEPIIKKADCIGALSKEHLQSSKVSSFVDWSKVVEIPNCVDADLFSPGEKNLDLVARYGLVNKLVVLFVGNLQPFKGLTLLIDAIAEIDDPRIVLLIVGGGYDETAIRLRVQERKIEKKVIFTGPKSPDTDLPDYYRMGDFLVLPSTHSESFGLVVLEAMASGIPAIVSSLPGPSQLVQEGKDGLIARVGDKDDLKQKIDFLARQQDKCQEMGAIARKKVVEKYSWKKISERLEAVFHAILSS